MALITRGSLQVERPDTKRASQRLLTCTHTASGHTSAVLSMFATQSYLFSASQGEPHTLHTPTHSTHSHTHPTHSTHTHTHSTPHTLPPTHTHTHTPTHTHTHYCCRSECESVEPQDRHRAALTRQALQLCAQCHLLSKNKPNLHCQPVPDKGEATPTLHPPTHTHTPHPSIDLGHASSPGALYQDVWSP